MVHLVQALQENQVLTALTLSNNQIGDTGMVHLVQALQGNQVLTELSLNNQRVCEYNHDIDVIPFDKGLDGDSNDLDKEISDFSLI